MRQTTRVVLGFVAIVAASLFPLEILFTDDGDARETSVPEESVPNLLDAKSWHCEDVTAEDDNARCGIVHICQSRRNTNAMALQISLSWNRMPVYRIWGPAGKTHQALRILESKVWTPPLPGGKMECGVARDTEGRLGIVFFIYDRDEPDAYAAYSFFPSERPPAPAVSARPLRRTNY